jgi:hypothetical protein
MVDKVLFKSPSDPILPARPLRSAIAAIFVSAITLVETGVAIASCPVSAARVLSRRSAGKLSWRRAASEWGGVKGLLIGQG